MGNFSINTIDEAREQFDLNEYEAPLLANIIIAGRSMRLAEKYSQSPKNSEVEKTILISEQDVEKKNLEILLGEASERVLKALIFYLNERAWDNEPL